MLNWALVGAMVAASDSRSEGYVFESLRGQKLFIFTLHVTLIISNNKSHKLSCTIGPCGAMVARLSPDQKVTYSNHVRS